MQELTYLQDKVQNFLQDKDEVTRDIVLATINTVNQRNLSTEALAKKVDRQIDQLLKETNKKGSWK
ncbi:hypothetical protein SH601_15080 [Gracilibacillus sp. S3-1-1]|uniref:Uncharacterized protein n=1 Tax=Gracilibacillus pellucidus TaxID=3095368 RepID=A0ACC6M942_9BACI|nr:hypothetical protein [Gracilibacillus sp. S3-1-1]MDX8047292.1 hypothetical protein [Gracilibacillus sp. S3-1-1]